MASKSFLVSRGTVSDVFHDQSIAIHSEQFRKIPMIDFAENELGGLKNLSKYTVIPKRCADRYSIQKFLISAYPDGRRVATWPSRLPTPSVPMSNLSVSDSGPESHKG